MLVFDQNIILIFTWHDLDMNLNVYLKACLYISDMSRYKSVWDKVSSSNRNAVIFNLKGIYRLEYSRCKIGYLTVTVRSEYFGTWNYDLSISGFTPTKIAELFFWKDPCKKSVSATWRKKRYLVLWLLNLSEKNLLVLT